MENNNHSAAEHHSNHVAATSHSAYSTHNKSESSHKLKNNLNTSSAIIIGSIIIGICLIIGLKIGGGSGGYAIDPDKIFQGRAFNKNEMMMGGPKDDVIFLSYSDTECPFCKSFENNVIKKIEENYKGKIGYAYRKYPLSFHTQAYTESLAALCARDQGGIEAYKKYNDETFARTKSNNGLNPNEINNIANVLKLDINKFNSCLVASSTDIMLKADIADGAAAGVEGTPYSMVLIRRGDEYQIISKINGARDYDYVAKAIDMAIKYK